MTVVRGNSLTQIHERELREPAWSLACDIITSGTNRELGTEVCKSQPDSKTFMTKNDISGPLYGENTQCLWREKAVMYLDMYKALVHWYRMYIK
jgi:hypothetical protein